MASTHKILQRYEKFLGLDLRSTELLRSPLAFGYLKNVEPLRTGPLSSRRGYKASCPSTGGLGLAKYGRVSTTDGSSTVEELAIGQTVSKHTDGTFSITQVDAASSSNPWWGASWFGGSWFGSDWYGGSEVVTDDVPVATCSILADGETITFTLYEDGEEVFSYDLGIGYDTASPVTLSDLEAAIGGSSGYSVAITGSGATPAAFLPTLFQEPFESGVLEIPFCYNTTLNQPSGATDPFVNTQSNRNADNFENVSWVNKNNVIYFGTPWDELKKYDGQKIYRAGMPEPSAAPTLTNAGAGNVNTGVHSVFYTYFQKDKQGNEVEGNASTAASITLGSARTVTVTVANIQNSTGFNTDCAVVSGGQTGVTTITTNAHSLKVGDIAYFLDRASSTYVEKTITAITTTSITFAGAVNVNNGDVISANLRVRIYATAAGGSTYYLVAEIPNLSTAATQDYSYNITDTTLLANEAWVDPPVLHDLPPKGAYVTSFQGLLCVGGIFAQPNTVWYSDVDSPEYFDPGLSFDCETIENDAITGLAPSNEFLAVFKTRAYFLAAGTLATGQYRVDQVSYHIGCVAHQTICDIEGALTFLSEDGPYQIQAGGVALSIGEQLFPLFSQVTNIDDYRLVLKRAVAVDDKRNEKYLLFIPAESSSSGSIYANSYSVLLVWDYYPGGDKTWWSWTNMDFSAGAIVNGEDLIWAERRLSTPLSTITNIIYKRSNRGDIYDYADHYIAIPWQGVTGWETMGSPSVYKKFLRIKPYATDPNIAAGYTLNVKTERNFISGVYDTDLDVVFGSGSGSGYSYTPYGTNYGDPTTPAMPYKLRSNKAESMRFTFSHETIYEAPLLTGFELEVALPYSETVKD